MTTRGLLLRVDGRELLLDFARHPWFRSAPVDALFRVRRPRAGHLRWPALDVDLELDAIEHPARYPLVSRAAPSVHEPRARRAARKPAR